MGVDYRAGIAYGIAISSDEMYEGLKNIADTIKSKEDLPEWFDTNEKFKKWYQEMIENENYNALEELLYKDDILINLDEYCNSAGYVLGYCLDCVDWGVKPLETTLLMDAALLMECKIIKWYQKLFPDKEIPQPQLLLYSQVW